MVRVHLFELHDQTWFPKTLRDAATDFMRFAAEFANPYRPVVPRLQRALAVTGNRNILDLCSGAAGPLVTIRDQLTARSYPVSIILTDIFPNRDAFEDVRRRTNGEVDFIEGPIDATCVPPHLPGLRTLFGSLHHFRPELARRILQDAVDQRQPIAVFEMTRRSLIPILGSLFLTPAVLLSTPFIRPFRWGRIFWTYLIPVIPVFVTWDAVVSCIRTYSLKELQGLVDRLGGQGYTWEIGLEAGRPAPISYLIGYPQ